MTGTLYLGSMLLYCTVDTGEVVMCMYSKESR
jgi:hypothetical protein